MSQTHRKWLAIDTDAGVDDAVALCLAMQLAESYGYEVKMISCVQGNCSLDQVAINVAKCREACRGVGNPEPKICIGSDKSLKGTQVDATFFHGNDGLGKHEVYLSNSRMNNIFVSFCILYMLILEVSFTNEYELKEM